MKRLLFFAAVAVLLNVSIVRAGPVNGIYVTTELPGGDVLDGRWSEASVNGLEGQVGNTISAASWDGSSLGTQWELSGAAIDSVPTLVDTYAEGNLTVRKYYTTYSGGTLTLKDTGSWWNPADSGTEYDLTIGHYSHDTTKYYDASGAEVSYLTTTLVHLNATFDDYPASSVDFLISVAIPTGSGAVPPMDYPDFAINGQGGAWGVAQKIRMEIVPEPATMALLGLGALLLKRRK